MYDKSNSVRDHAINCLLKFTDYLTSDDIGNQILTFILSLAHEEKDEVARVSALQILNKLATFLPQELCEVYIVKEVKSLGIDEFPVVRQHVAGNLTNICSKISGSSLISEIIPLLLDLSKDKDQEVRLSCVKQIPEISKNCPAEVRLGRIEELFLTLLKDTDKKVKIATFSHLAKFIVSLETEQLNEDYFT